MMTPEVVLEYLSLLFEHHSAGAVCGMSVY